MENQRIFDSFDMVLSIKQKTINAQINNLLETGLVKTSFGLKKELKEDGKFTYTLIDKIPEDPKESCFFGEFRPSVFIDKTGSIIVFSLTFTSGAACFWKGFGPNASLHKYEMKDWVYSANVNLDLRELRLAEDGGNHQLKLPANQPDQQVRIDPDALKQLEKFQEEHYSINCLFANFENGALWDTDIPLSKAGDSGDIGLEQLEAFMKHYLENLTSINKGNPYVLGYFPEIKKAQAENNIPEILQASGVTYSCFKDPNPDNSSLNYLLVTKGGKRIVPEGEFKFDSNWVSSEDAQAKMIYSPKNVMVDLILKPFYHELSAKMHDEVVQVLGDIPRPNAYDAAVKQESNGFTFNAVNWKHDHQEYGNQMTVTFDKKEDGLYLNFSGDIKVTAYDDVDILFVQGSVTDITTVHWQKTVRLTIEKNKQGEDILKTDFSEEAKIHDAHDQNFDGPAAKLRQFFSGLFDAIDGLLHFFNADFLTALTSIFHDIFDVDMSHLTLDDIGNELGGSMNATIVLPAGNTFFMKSPDSYPYGALSTELFYQSES